MAPRKAAASNSAAATKPKANTRAKVTKAQPTSKPTKDKPAAKTTNTTASKTQTSTKAATTKAAAAKKSAVKNTTKATTAASAQATKSKAKASAKADDDDGNDDDDDDEGSKKKPTKRKASDDGDAAPPPAKKQKRIVKGATINEAPKTRLNVFVYGEGTAGELGLGTAKTAVDVKRPRLNPNLDAEKVGVVQIAAGGMHVAALTHDNRILTWGVNDQGALGRDTKWEGGLKDADDEDDKSDDDSDEGDDNGLNPLESVPGEVDFSTTQLADGTYWTQVAAGDSFTLALTDDGKVYGWGTFRSNEGIFGFTPDHFIAERPVLIQGLTNTTSIKAGANHALALTNKGAVFAWGSGQQNQLGRRVIERTKVEGLKPREFGLPKGAKNKITSISAGPYHNFAISKNGSVYSWGLNSFGATGIPEQAGDDDATVLKPKIVELLKEKTIVSINGAAYHSVAATSDGECLVWGRCDGHQLGLTDDEIAKLPEDDVVIDEHGKRRIVIAPQSLPLIKGSVVHVATSGEHNVVITKEGKAWSWGFSENYQTGQGTTDDIVVPTMIDNTAVRERKLNGAETGGQYGIVTCPAEVANKKDDVAEKPSSAT